jgi:phosphatidylglycerophosphate synthase
MSSSNSPLESVRNMVRRGMRQVARVLNKITGGHLSPNAVTMFGFAMHIPIAILIAGGYFIYAALLLVVFGLFDTLDGQLAQLQNSSSKTGMLLDSVTDRMKEVIIYTSIAYFFVWSSHPNLAVLTVAACGASVLVSYINAWGEVVSKDIKDSAHQTNKAFRGGLMTFDVRMFVIAVGLLANQLGIAIILIAILSWFTAFGRLYRISRYLKKA